MSFFSRNIGFQSRMARGVLGTILLIVGILLADFSGWGCLALVVPGLFAIFEAMRGWCLARALASRAKSLGDAEHET
jgi:hypothetical protein